MWSVLFKILLAIAIIGPVIYMQEPILMVLAAPVVAFIFSPDLLNLFLKSIRVLRKQAYKGDARVYQYGYFQIRLIEWQGRPWFSAVPVCGALGFDDPEGSINYYATTDYCIYGSKKEQFLTAQGVLRLCARSRSGDATNFRTWFEKEVLGTLPDDLRRRARLTSTSSASTVAAPQPAAPAQSSGEAPATVPVAQMKTGKAPVKLDIEL